MFKNHLFCKYHPEEHEDFSKKSMIYNIRVVAPSFLIRHCPYHQGPFVVVLDITQHRDHNNLLLMPSPLRFIGHLQDRRFSSSSLIHQYNNIIIIVIYTVQ